MEGLEEEEDEDEEEDEGKACRDFRCTAGRDVGMRFAYALNTC